MTLTTHLGTDANKKWSRIESYGPKFVENIVRAISRDILAEAMRRLRNYHIVGHVHDEVIIEADQSSSAGDLRYHGTIPNWLPEICLRADGYECGYYKS